MGFVKIKDFNGIMFIPEDTGRPKKHSCADCFSCNFCSDERCTLCLKGKPEPEKINCINKKLYSCIPDD